MVSYGANCIYATDSAGYMLPDDVTARIGLLRAELPKGSKSLPRSPQHGHGDRQLLAAIEAGASRIDGSVAGLGAGAGNTPLEVFCAVLDRMGVETGVDLYKIMDVAEDLIVPIMDQPIRVDRPDAGLCRCTRRSCCSRSERRRSTASRRATFW